ncbi:hypothetical protein NEF87_003743 [Candidatus Lokiarchaeum ossiferum]|uniref:Uncharacterized protein n=1 Tax=Candidatus Lokiarchaeum ossiferum TaxID=2951803 RepID=A0ABY6HVB3_9ARCH|nr:hypothetical protein NEF87_003743 [Candidatus Lokiarchaeum sp. B-35]
MSSKSLFLNDIIKYSILFLIFQRGNKCNAKQIQDILGFKKQTTYNYLKELINSGDLIVSSHSHETKKHINVSYYQVSNPSKFFEFKQIEALKNMIDHQQNDELSNIDPDKIKQEFRRFMLFKIAKNLKFNHYLQLVENQDFIEEIMQNRDKLPSKQEIDNLFSE